MTMSFLGDVGGGAIRKEIVKAGGMEVMKMMGSEATKEGRWKVVKACGFAVMRITENLWSRNEGE